MSNKVYRVGVVGCGAISDIYITNMIHLYKNLEVVACCAAHFENAVAKAEKYGIEAREYDGILSDESIDIVVVLTPAPTHYGLIKAALLAGKHVYTEKTMTVNLEEAAELVKLADEKNLYLGSAPDTFLGSALQTVKKAIADGVIGEVTGFRAYANRDITLLASVFKFLRMQGGGICYDYGVYYLTALCSILGPVDRVSAIVQNKAEVRVNSFEGSPEFGEEYRYDNESSVNAVLQMRSGVAGTFVLNGDSAAQDMASFAIYGTKGVLLLTDPNGFGGTIRLATSSWTDSSVVDLENHFPFSENSRGIGVAEMADAISEGRPNRAAKEMAYHVLEIITRVMESNESGSFEKVTSDFTVPAPFDDGSKLC